MKGSESAYAVVSPQRHELNGVNNVSFLLHRFKWLRKMI
jgi:hypothetical protein